LAGVLLMPSEANALRRRIAGLRLNEPVSVINNSEEERVR
jgi:hypothetical protein